ncbi:MAG: hypothetical protein H0V25_10880 [Solirubrobacterales bacterium]|nr:hypothetical protein [Solirubrobacterales bacterium]
MSSPPRPQPVLDVSPAAWVESSIGRFGSGVGGLLPEGFSHYARILHPASKDEGPPEQGTLPPEPLTALCDVLGRHTETPGQCWFCLWEGVGWIEAGRLQWHWLDGDPPPTDSPPVIAASFAPEVLAGPRVRLPERDYILLHGPLESATQLGYRFGELCAAAGLPIDDDVDAFFPQSPHLAWPEDRAWCVATEIDLDSTYVAGSEKLIAAVLADDRLEALPVERGDSLVAPSDGVDQGT